MYVCMYVCMCICVYATHGIDTNGFKPRGFGAWQNSPKPEFAKPHSVRAWYVCICVCMCMYVYDCIFLFTHIPTYKACRPCVPQYLSISVRLSACLSVSKYVYVCIKAYTYEQARMEPGIWTCLCSQPPYDRVVHGNGASPRRPHWGFASHPVAPVIGLCCSPPRHWHCQLLHWCVFFLPASYLPSCSTVYIYTLLYIEFPR